MLAISLLPPLVQFFATLFASQHSPTCPDPSGFSFCSLLAILKEKQALSPPILQANRFQLIKVNPFNNPII
jgi:hypothetical protein